MKQINQRNQACTLQFWGNYLRNILQLNTHNYFSHWVVSENLGKLNMVSYHQPQSRRHHPDPRISVNRSTKTNRITGQTQTWGNHHLSEKYNDYLHVRLSLTEAFYLIQSSHNHQSCTWECPRGGLTLHPTNTPVAPLVGQLNPTEQSNREMLGENLGMLRRHSFSLCSL